MAVKQSDTQLALEARERLRDGRLADAEPDGGAGDLAGFDHGDEPAQLAQLD